MEGNATSGWDDQKKILRTAAGTQKFRRFSTQ